MSKKKKFYPPQIQQNITNTTEGTIPQEVKKSGSKLKWWLTGIGLVLAGLYAYFKNTTESKNDYEPQTMLAVPEATPLTKTIEISNKKIEYDIIQDREDILNLVQNPLNLTKMLFLDSINNGIDISDKNPEAVYLNPACHFFQLKIDGRYFIKLSMSFEIGMDPDNKLSAINYINGFSNLYKLIAELCKYPTKMFAKKELYSLHINESMTQFLPVNSELYSHLKKNNLHDGIIDFYNAIMNDETEKIEGDGSLNYLKLTYDIYIPFKEKNSESGINLYRASEIVKYIKNNFEIYNKKTNGSFKYENFVFHPESCREGDWNYCKYFIKENENIIIRKELYT